MNITALAPWFGSKRNLAPAIVEELGKHRVYWEPFCGSMSVLLSKPPCVMETVNDLHGDLVNIARVIQHPKLGPEFYRRVRRVWMAEELFDESGDVIRTEAAPEEIDPERAFHYFVTAWLGRNGVAGTSNYNSGYCVRYTSNGGHAAKRWDSAVRSIPAWRKRLANVTILNRDSLSLLPRIDDTPGTAIYCDPPYFVKGSKYLHDFTEQHHRDLAEQLARFKHVRVVVSYYEHPLLDQLYPGWTQRRIVVTKAMASQGKRDADNNVKAVEVLLMNGPSLRREESGGRLFA